MNHQFRRLRSVILLTAVLLALIADSQLRIVTDYYTVSSDRLPDGFDGFRIVQISDLHGRQFGKDNQRLLSAVRRCSPDLVVITGDLVDQTEEIASLAPFLTELTAIAPCSYVSGNHEWACGALDELSALLRAHGVRYLRNEYVPLKRNGDSILLLGAEDPNGPSDMPRPDELVARVRSMQPDSFSLYLSHRNTAIDQYPELDVDVILCGHGHGGLIRLPFLGGLIRADRGLFPEYVDGVFHTSRYDMIVSRGLGNVPGTFRFLNNPELVCVILESVCE